MIQQEQGVRSAQVTELKNENKGFVPLDTGKQTDKQVDEITGRPKWRSNMPSGASIALAFHVVKERFGRAETQEHVEPNGDMIVVISHIKVDNTLVFLVFELKISQPKTLVFRAIVGLYGCSSIETDLRRRAVIAVNNREIDHETLFPVGRIKGTSPHKDAHHVVDTVVVAVSCPRMRAIVVHSVLTHMTFAATVAIEHLVNGVTLPFAGSFAEVKRLHFEAIVAK